MITLQKSEYDLTIIIKSGAEKEIQKTTNQILENIKNFGGEIIKEDAPILKRLSYEIKGQKDAYIFTVIFKSGAETPNQVKRSLSIMDNVLRYVLIKGK